LPGLDAGNGAIASATSAGGMIVGISTTEVSGRLAALWFEIYADPSAGITSVVEQVGTIVDPAADLIAPAIAFDPYSGIGVVGVRSSLTEPPGIYVTGQAFGDPPSSMQPLAIAQPGTARYSCAPVGGVTAFGRYSSIASTATGFWAVAQYGASSADCAFGTAWVNFSVPVTNSADDPIGAEDDFYRQHGSSTGCGCASLGDGSPALMCTIVIVLGIRWRRSRAAT
jgi:hypothetical protein